MPLTAWLNVQHTVQQHCTAYSAVQTGLQTCSAAQGDILGWHYPLRLLSPTGLALLGLPRLGEDLSGILGVVMAPLQLTLKALSVPLVPERESRLIQRLVCQCQCPCQLELPVPVPGATDYRAQRPEGQGL